MGGESENLRRLGEKINQVSGKTESLFSSAVIYRVPEDLRKLNESAYTPRLIAIGPLHRYDKHLQTPMQGLKMYYTSYLLSRLVEGLEGKEQKSNKVTEDLGNCLNKMKEMESQEALDNPQKYYAEEVKLNDDDISESEMMVVDGCFILELLYMSYHANKKSKEEKKGGDSGNSKASSSSGGGKQGHADPILHSILTANLFKQDLLLLENQIPFSVLQELFNLTVNQIQGENKVPLTEYVISYFSDIISPEGESSGSEKKTSCSSPCDCVIWFCGSTNECEPRKKVSQKANDYYHILHLLHEHYLPGDQGENSNGGCSPCRCTIAGCGSPHCCTLALSCSSGCHTPPKKLSKLAICASDLDYAGVKFVPVEGKNLFDVTFKERKGLCWWFNRATFTIPTLKIHDTTEPFLRNLIAFEQCCPKPKVSLYFTSYAKLMDMLINSTEDVQVLQKAEVIHNYLGSEKEVSDVVNKLCKEVVLGQFYFNDECLKAFKYSKRRWPKFMAYLRRTYFASPWAFIGFCLALIAFGIQITNFVRSFLK